MRGINHRAFKRDLLAAALAAPLGAVLLTVAIKYTWHLGPQVIAWGVTGLATIMLLGVLTARDMRNNLINKSLEKLTDDLNRRLRRGHYVPIQLSTVDVIKGPIREINQLLATLKNAQEFENQRNTIVDRRVAHRTHGLSLALRRMEKTATTDALTGIANRSYFNAVFEELFDQASSNESDLACIMIDVDYFKSVNDTFGHAVGDKLIHFVGELLRASTRDGDVCARFGGDEFVMLLWDCSAKNAQAVAERVRRLFVREVPLVIRALDSDTPDEQLAASAGQRDIRAGLSIGVATLKTDQTKSTAELMLRADEALYRAKAAGRNQVVASCA